MGPKMEARREILLPVSYIDGEVVSIRRQWSLVGAGVWGSGTVSMYSPRTEDLGGIAVGRRFWVLHVLHRCPKVHRRALFYNTSRVS